MYPKILDNATERLRQEKQKKVDESITLEGALC